MKNFLAAGVGLFGFFFLAAPGRAGTNVTDFIGTGDWGVPGNWHPEGGTPAGVPGAGDTAVIDSGSTANFTNTDTDTVQEFALGNNALTSAAILNISGGSLTAGTSYVGRQSNLSNAILTLSGGSMTMTSGSVLNIGNNLTNGAGNVSQATFTGGTFQGGLTIGNSSANQTGLLTVKGNGTLISGSGNQGFLINATGTLAFILEPSGASPLDYSANTNAGAVTFVTGSQLTVDASLYVAYTTQSAQTIVTLIKYNNIGNSVVGYTSGNNKLKAVVTGIQPDYTGEIVNDTTNKAIELIITPVTLTTISVTLSTTPGSGNANQAAFQTALNSAETCTTACKLLLPGPGIYPLSIPTSELPVSGQRQILDLKVNHNPVVIEGNGATIQITDPSEAFLNLTNCTNIAVRNLVLDHALPPWSGGQVQTVSEAGGIVTIVLKVMAPNTSLSESCFGSGPGAADQQWGYVLNPLLISGSTVNPAYAGQIKANDQNVEYTSSIVPDPNDETGTLFDIAFAPGSGTDIVPLDYYVQLARYSGGSQLYSVGCKYVTYSNVTIYSSASADFGGRQSDYVSVLNCHVEVESGRWKSSDADGANFGDDRFGPHIENCLFSGQSDDGTNFFTEPDYINSVGSNTIQLSSTTSPVTYPTSYQISAGNPPLTSPDILVFLDPASGKILGSVTVGAYNAATGTVTLAQGSSLPSGLNPGLSTSDTQVYNMGMNSNQFIIRDNVYSNSRRYGNIICGINGLIEGNAYTDLSGSALALYDEPAYGNSPLGLDCQNVVISSNNIQGCGFDANYNSSPFSAAIAIYARNAAGQFVTGTGSSNFHQNLSLIENTINGWQLCGILASNIDVGLIQGNSISPSGSSPLIDAPNDSAVLQSYNIEP